MYYIVFIFFLKTTEKSTLSDRLPLEFISFTKIYYNTFSYFNKINF